MVSEATKDDVQVLVRMRLLLQLHMEAANPRILKHNKKWENNLLRFYGDLIDDPNSLVLVALDIENRQVISMLIGQLIEDDHFEVERFVKINDVWVDEGYREKGICSYLFRKLIDFYKERGITTFTLNYVIDNLEAEDTWNALGFKPIISSCVATIN